jgi:TatA/E family protein of Tat protein translocase
MPSHPLWIVAILVVVLIIFGPGRLPELGSAAGKAMREFRKATSELTDSISSASTTPAAAPPAEPTPPATTTATAHTGDGAAKTTEPASSPKN